MPPEINKQVRASYKEGHGFLGGNLRRVLSSIWTVQP